MSDDDGGVNVGMICGVVLQRGAPIEAHVSLLSIVSSDGPELYWSKTGGHVGAVYSNKQGEYSITFFWDASSPLMMGAHYRLRGVHKHTTARGSVDGTLDYRVSMKALSEMVFDSYVTKSVLKPLKLAGFLKKARSIASAFKRSTSSVEYTPELYAVFAVTDIHVQ